jgi:hypothetical protein
MITGAVLDHVWHEYWGPVDLCKGDSLAEQSEASTLTFQNTLQNIFSQQYATQSNTLNYLNGKMQAQVNAGGTGYNAATLAAMRTSATDQNAAAVQNAQRASQNAEFNEGGQNLPSGVNAQINAGIATAGAQQQAATQEGITQQNAQLQNANYWQATNVLSGNAAQANPLGYASAGNQAGSTVAGLSSANTAADGPTAGALVGQLGAAALAGGGAAL